MAEETPMTFLGLYWHFWAAAGGAFALLLLVAWALWRDERAGEYDATLGVDRLPRTPAAWMAPLRGDRGETDVMERRIRLAHRVLDRVVGGRRLPK